MSNRLRGEVYWYDYGEIVGHELSSHRRALVISRDDVNAQLHVAITLPMSETPPPFRHRRQHIHVADSGSWASVRQVRSVRQDKMGTRVAQATDEELELALESLVERMASNRNRPGNVQTETGPQLVAKGTVWNVGFHNSDDEPYDQPMLLLDYNDGNKLALAVRIEPEQRKNTPVRISINVNQLTGTREPASALIHHIRPIDVSERPMEKTGTIDRNDLNEVTGGLLAMLDPKQTR